MRISINIFGMKLTNVDSSLTGLNQLTPRYIDTFLKNEKQQFVLIKNKQASSSVGVQMVLRDKQFTRHLGHVGRVECSLVRIPIREGVREDRLDFFEQIASTDS